MNIKPLTFDALRNIKKGQYITFGAYEQDNNTLNGKGTIEWLVLEVKNGKALVISKYALDYLYAATKEECEKKLSEMIMLMKEKGTC